MKVILLKICIFFLKIYYFFCKLFKTKNKITLISRQSNTITLDYELLSKELKKKYPKYEIVILMKKIENPIKYVFHMLRQCYHIATSKVVILDSYCIAISVLNHKKSLKVIQIWHAIGCMKKFGYAMIGKEEGSDEKIAKTMKMHNNYDCITISSMNFVKDFIEGFNVKKDIIREIPLPRVDFLLNKKEHKKTKEQLYKRIPKLKNKINILYCGTFRKEKNQSNQNIIDLTNCIDFDKYNLLYKPHPLNKVKTNDERIIQDFSSTLEAMIVSDVVICDYSSIIYEAGLLNKPIYIYAYDWEEYKTKRELNFDMEKEIPTLFTPDPKEIMNAIENKVFDYDAYRKFTYKNVTIPKKGSCTSKLVELVDEFINKSNNDN